MKLIKILIGLLLYFNLHASNIEEFQCPDNLEQSPIMSQTGGLYKPSSNGINEYMKALVVFVQFADTPVDINNPTWPKNQMPTWANNLISSEQSSNYPDFTISDYWKDMSMGTFDFIGDVYENLVIINTEDYYRTNGYSFGECNKDALTQINPYVNFSEYDKWSFNSSTGQFDFASDGYVDMIIMIYRTPVDDPGWFGGRFGNYFGAIALLSDYDFTLNFDGVSIFGDDRISNLGSGLTLKVGLKGHLWSIPTIAHEYGHYLFGGGHGNTGGIMSGNHALSAVERERLGHIAYTNCTQNNFTLTLEDFIMNGDVLKIPIPITNQNSTTFFLVENHQKLSKNDQIIRGGSIGGGYDYTDTGSGIYVWLVKNGDSSIPGVYYEALAADGRWDWMYDGDYYAGPGWYYGRPWEGYLPQTKRTAVNRNNGKTDKKKEHIFWNGEWAAKWVDKWIDNQPTDSYHLTRNVMGDEYDAFNFGYNELLTPWSNPSTYVNGNTNISIQLYNQNGNNITVKVFTTETSAEALPPSNPQFLLVSNYNNHPYLTWDANTEPDLNKYQLYKKKGNDPFEPYTWINKRATAFVDYNEDVIVGPHQANETMAKYKLTAIDNDLNESNFSNIDEILVEGGALEKPIVNDPHDPLIEDNDIIPTDFSISQNYPNPFNPETNITFGIPEDNFVSLVVYNIQGEKIAALVNEQLSAGTYTVKFDGSVLPSGVYIYRINAGSFSQIKRMLLIK